MGTVTSIEAWQRGRDDRDPTLRLERAVQRLESVLRHLPSRESGTPSVEQELLAITGAVSIGLLEDAAERAERLAERLASRARRGG